MPDVTGILETALYTGDLERLAAFYRDVLGFRELMREDGRLIALAVGKSRQVLLLFAEGKSTKGVDTPGGHIIGHDGHGPLHLCFSIAPETLDDWQAHLATQGVMVESIVQVPGDADRRGGTSVYFRDPDGHAVEFASSGIWPTF